MKRNREIDLLRNKMVPNKLVGTKIGKNLLYNSATQSRANFFIIVIDRLIKAKSKASRTLKLQLKV